MTTMSSLGEYFFTDLDSLLCDLTWSLFEKSNHWMLASDWDGFEEVCV